MKPCPHEPFAIALAFALAPICSEPAAMPPTQPPVPNTCSRWTLRSPMIEPDRSPRHAKSAHPSHTTRERTQKCA